MYSSGAAHIVESNIQISDVKLGRVGLDGEYDPTFSADSTLNSCLIHLCVNMKGGDFISLILIIQIGFHSDLFSGHGDDLEWQSLEEIVKVILSLRVVGFGCFNPFGKQPNAKIEIFLFKFKALMQDMLA